MGKLFDVLLFYRSVQFWDWSTVRVYWAIEEPIFFKDSYANINEEFDRVLAEFGLVLYTREVMQCSVGYITPTAAESARREVIEAFREHGLDVDARSREINLLKGGVSGMKGERRPRVQYMMTAPHEL